MVRILGTAFAALAGLAFGSFLNVCLTRWPLGESIVKPRSHCRACGRTLAWWENIPAVSWIALGGRCRTCGAWIAIRYPLVELAIGSLWAIVAWRFSYWGPSFSLPNSALALELARSFGRAVFFWLVVALAALDAENLWLPDWLTWPGIGLGFVYSVVPLPVFGGTFALSHWGPNVHVRAAIAALTEMGLSAFLILLIRWLYKLLRKREGIGLGDAKLMAMLAAWLGLPGALLSFFIGVILGALTALVLLALPRANAAAQGSSEKPTQESNSDTPSWALRKLPFGTFLCIGGIVSALWGQPILAAYLRWAGF
jgi:leader peptidase (prepilin peptidase) / N-methyltransferase